MRCDARVLKARWREEEEARTSTAFAAGIAIAALPTLLLLGRAGWRRLLRRGANAESIVGVQGAATSPSRSATAAVNLSARLRALLAPQRSRECCTWRGSLPLYSGGGCSSALRWDRWVQLDAGERIENVLWWLVPLPLGICILLLALFPTDARAIRVVCATLLVVLTGLGALFIGAGDLSMKIGEGAFGLPLAVRCSSLPPPRSFLRCAAAAIAPCSPAPPCDGCGGSAPCLTTGV
eukprot:scaffold75883_cov76-Phaeocystis_antarctica.AAC.2